MAVPTISLSTTGTDPKSTTKQILESAVNAALAELYSLSDDAVIAAAAAAAASEAAAAASEDSAAASSAAAGASSGRLDVGSFAQLSSKFNYTGTGGRELAAEGDIILWREMGLSYEVLASGASGAHLDYTGSGGVKLTVLPGADGALNLLAFGDTTVTGVQTLFKTAADAAIAAQAPLDVPAGEYEFTAAVALGAGLLHLRVHAGAEIRGASVGGHDLFQLTGTSMTIEDNGGLWEQFRYIFSYEATGTEIHPVFTLNGNRALFRDYNRWINLPDGHNTSSDIVANLRGFDLLPRYTASTTTSYDVLQNETSSLKIKQWIQSDYTAFGGQRFHCRWLRSSGNEGIYVNNFDVREYINNGSGSDADAQFFFPRSNFTSITNGYMQGLRIGSSSIDPSDTEGIRGGGANFFLDNVTMVDAGATEATLSLKGCTNAKIGSLRLEYTDGYKTEIMAGAGSVKRVQPILVPIGNLDIDNLSVVNCNASIFDVEGSATTPRVNVNVLTMTDCLLDVSTSTAYQGVIRYSGSDTFFRIGRLDIVTTAGNDSKIPVSLVRNLAAGTVIVESGNMKFSGEVISVLGATTVRLIDISGDLTLGADSSSTRILSRTDAGTITELRLDLCVLNGGARASPVQLFTQTAMQSVGRARIKLDWRFNSEVVNAVRFLYLYAPDNSVSRMRLLGQVWNHTAGDGADLQQDIWWITTPTASVAALATAVNTVRQTGSTFTAPTSPLTSGGLQLRLVNTTAGNVCSGAALIEYEHERTGA
jgi:hypothetical protein